MAEGSLGLNGGEPRGLVFDLQRYSLHDGPGIRTIVFLKGCPLRCLWCCNPESQRMSPEVEFRDHLCRRCGRCRQACPLGAVNPDLHCPPADKLDRARCTACGECARACPAGALRVVGEWMTVEAVLSVVRRDAAYYRRSGGGVTLSGGEPLAQPAFALALSRACHDANIHTAVETSGCAAWEHYQALLPYVGVFLYDFKHMRPADHKRQTGVDNELILANARRLAAAGASIVARIPLIPGHNLDDANLDATAAFVAGLGASEVHLMPFHQLGKGKYRRFGRAYALDTLAGLYEVAPEAIQRARAHFQAHGLAVQVGG